MPAPPPGATALVAGAAAPIADPAWEDEAPALAGAVTGAGVAFDLSHERFAGLGDAAAGAGAVAAVVVAAASFFLERLLGAGEVAAGAEDVAALVSGAVLAASFFLERLCLATDASGLAAGAGDWATSEVTEKPINAIIRPIDLLMLASY